MPTPANASDTYKQQIREIAVGTKGLVDSSMSWTVTGAATAIQPAATAMSFQLVGKTGSPDHSGTSTISIEGSNDGTNYVTLGTISVTGTASDGFALAAAGWENIRGNCTAHSGTGTIQLYIGY